MDGLASVIWGITALIILLVWYLKGRREKQVRLERIRQAEAARGRLNCEDVVRFYANHFGYLARQAISRNELEELIDSGISAADLVQHIDSQIIQLKGLRLGFQQLLGFQTPVILPTQYRDKHVYVVGKSGYGKTNFLRYLILQDIEDGHGVGVVAPEFEMLRDELLPLIPDHRTDDVIYFNPADLGRPVVLNPLHLEDGADIDLQVDETFTILRRIVGEGGPRMDQILRQSLYALTERPGSTLLDFEPLLSRSDQSLRREIIEKSQDELTRNFFASTYLQMPKDAHLPILNRIGRFVRAKYIRNCLCPASRSNLNGEEVEDRLLNIRKAMNEGKILLFNLSDGLLGEAASQLIGQLIVSKFQTATMSRADIAKGSRRPFYLYLDEFQNFCGVASQSYERMLSRARKYGLGLILAHQQTGQIPFELMREIFGNVTTLVSFQLAQADAAKLSREFVAQVDFDMESVPVEEFLRLGIGEAWVKLGRSAFPMKIPKVEDSKNSGRSKEIVARSRSLYGIPRNEKPPDEAQSEATLDLLDDIDPEGVFD